MSAAQQQELRFVSSSERYRTTKAHHLREVLGDGRWHFGSELDGRVGWRFGAALERIRNGWDGLPAWRVDKERCNEEGSVWRYCFVGLEPNPRPLPGQTWKGRALKAEARVRELETMLTGGAAHAAPCV